MGTPQSNEQSSSNAGEAEALASRQATIQREASFRSQAVTNFVLNLESLKDDLSNAKPDETERIEALLSRLQSVLDAHKSAFTHPEGERPSEAPANQ